jgi:hypothetical protein
MFEIGVQNSKICKNESTEMEHLKQISHVDFLPMRMTDAFGQVTKKWQIASFKTTV